MNDPLFEAEPPFRSITRSYYGRIASRGQPDPHVQGGCPTGKRRATEREPHRREAVTISTSPAPRCAAVVGQRASRSRASSDAHASRNAGLGLRVAAHLLVAKGTPASRSRKASAALETGGTTARGCSPKCSPNSSSTANTLTNTCARPSPRKHWGFVRPGGGEPSRTTRPPRVAFGVVRLG